MSLMALGGHKVPLELQESSETSFDLCPVSAGVHRRAPQGIWE